jgi:Predicted membrane protein (DUF2231).
MKLLGHPIHTMIIHFPTALLPMELVLSFLFFKTANTSFGSAAFYCAVGGVAIGVVSMLTGLIDLLGFKKEQKEALGVGLIHGFINGTVIIVYAVIAYKEWKVYPEIPLPTPTMLIVKALAVLTLLVGNYYGGSLIYKHRIGIKQD